MTNIAMINSLKKIIAPKKYLDYYDSYIHEKRLNPESKSFYYSDKEYKVDFLASLFIFSYKYGIGFGVFSENVINSVLHITYDSFILAILVRATVTVVISLLIEAISIRMFVRSIKNP